MGRTLTVLVAVACLVVTGVGWSLMRGLDLSGASGLDTQENVLDGAHDILLVGTDNRTDAQGNELSQEEIDMLRAGDDDGEENTDTIILIRVPEDGSSATAISIPRDTYVSTPNLGNQRINGVLALARDQAYQREIDRGSSEQVAEERAQQAGRNALIGAISQLTGVEVDHYAEIGLLGFILMTDAVGGVQVCLNNDVNEPMSGANFHAGVQTVNGADALSFVRQRHGLPAGDLDRIVRQQVFMSQLVSQVLSAGTLADPSRMSSLVDAARRSFIIDENWDFVDFAMKLSDISGGNVRFETIPVTDVDAVGDYGEAVIDVDEAAVQWFVEQFATKETAEALTSEEDSEGPDSAEGGMTESAGEVPGSDGAGEPGEDGPELDERPVDPTDPDQPVSDEAVANGPGENPAGIEPPPGFDPAMSTIDVVNTSDVDGFADSVMQALSEAGFSQGELTTDLNGAFSSYVEASSMDQDGGRYVSDLLDGVPLQINDTLPPGLVRVVLTEDYDGPRYSLDPERAAQLEAEAALDHAAQTLPPEIAQRPTFDAGNSDVPCVN